MRINEKMKQNINNDCEVCGKPVFKTTTFPSFPSNKIIKLCLSHTEKVAKKPVGWSVQYWIDNEKDSF